MVGWIVLALAALAVALALAAWVYGWSAERWTRPVGAALRNVRERTADLAAEFWDWVRLGR